MIPEQRVRFSDKIMPNKGPGYTNIHRIGGTTVMIVKLMKGAAVVALLAGSAGAAQAQIAVGQLADTSGPTSDVGTPYAAGVSDALAWVNKNGGVDGKKLNVDMVDYSYQVPRAIAQY